MQSKIIYERDSQVHKHIQSKRDPRVLHSKKGESCVLCLDKTFKLYMKHLVFKVIQCSLGFELMIIFK